MSSGFATCVQHPPRQGRTLHGACAGHQGGCYLTASDPVRPRCSSSFGFGSSAITSEKPTSSSVQSEYSFLEGAKALLALDIAQQMRAGVQPVFPSIGLLRPVAPGVEPGTAAASSQRHGWIENKGRVGWWTLRG
eukprot:2606806-Rhodomonas_salina.2